MFNQKQTTPATGLTFPQATPTTGSSLFGGGAQTATGFPSAQPQQQDGQIDMSRLSGTTPATGLTFPQATPTTGSSLFGGGAQTATGFPSAQPQQQGFSFPQAQLTTSQPTTGFQLPSANTAAAPNVSFFGSTLGGQTKPATQMPTATQGFGFSTPKATAAAPATTAATGFPFGFSNPAPAASAAPTLTPNFGIGSSASTAPAPTLATATSAPSTTVGFNLGITPQTTTSTGLTFPAPTSTATPTLSFGIGTGMTATSTAAPAFGLPTATTAAPAFGLPSATTAAPAFGLPSATTAAPTFGLTTAAPAFGLPTATTAAPAFGLPSATTAVTSSAPSSVPTLGGLGGTTSFNIGKGMSLATKSDQLKANPLTSVTTAPNQTPQPLNYKDELIPPQLMTLVESFKVFVKDQKSSSSIVNRASLKQIAKVTEDAELLKRMTMQLERTVNKNKAQNKKLREYVARGIQDSEVVQHLSMDPRGFPADNPLAFEYFRTIVDRFQQQAESLTVELKSMEKHIVCKLHPSPFTPEELSAIMKQLYECFVALAGRYQSIHSSVTSLKLDLQRKKDPWYALNSMGYYQSNTMLK